LPINISKTIAVLLYASCIAHAADSRSEGSPDASSVPASKASKSGKKWIAEHKGWIIAGGAALVAGTIILANIALDDEEVRPRKAADIGQPPADPAVLGSK
jgi:hypothetical protein